jgi:hypothetical protein
MLTLLVSGAAAGLVLHQFVKRVEIDKHPLLILGNVIGVYFILAPALKHFDGINEGSLGASSAAFMLEASAIISLWVNILVYV